MMVNDKDIVFPSVDLQATSEGPVELDEQQNLDGFGVQGTSDGDEEYHYEDDSNNAEGNFSSFAESIAAWFHTWPLTW